MVISFSPQGLCKGSELSSFVLKYARTPHIYGRYSGIMDPLRVRINTCDEGSNPPSFLTTYI